MSTLTRARAREVDAHVVTIARRIIDGVWTPEATEAFAVEQGVQSGTVREWSAEAMRMLRVGADVEAYRAINLRRLDETYGEAKGDPKAKVAAVAEQNRMLGLHAPLRHEHAVVVAQYEQMPRANKAQWLREKAAALIAEADRLESVDADVSPMR